MNYNGTLSMVLDPHREHSFISTDEDSLFYKVPTKIMSYIDGFRTLVNFVAIDYDEDNDQVEFCVTEDPFARKRFTVKVPLDKIFKILEEEGLPKENIDDQLYAIRNRSELITRALSRYAKKYLQIIEYDPSMQEENSPTDKSGKRRSSNIQSSKRKSNTQPKETLFTLVNNDGNQIRRPKMTLSPLDSANLLERQNTNPARKRLPNTNGDKSSHNPMVPPDLVQY